ncbi:MAG TPA: glycosyltransferase family 4 protein [Jatrophihabitantaceae bacterium]|nr:glycosyltransferase family 4 protein [Jatrophihabitantaceae bacterium]
MRILLMSWEYPPLVVGGLGRHVEALARQLAASGHDVRVVTRGEREHGVEETRDGVRIRRAAVDPIAIDFTTETLLAWTQASEHALVRAALPWVRRWRPDVVHAHDWLVAQSAITVAEATGAPLVTTVHATEAGRHQGWLPRPLNLAIHSVERWLVHRSQAVITCSRAMHDEATRLFEVDAAHVSVVPNGIDAARWRANTTARTAARDRHHGNPLIVFAGRLVHEKGVQTLLDAVRPLRSVHPGLRLVVAGTGVHEATLHARARRLRIARSVDWLGFVAEDDVAALLGAADVVVVPSLYEPFGIVALEAAAAHTPLVVAETGGLIDLVIDGVATASFAPKDVDGLVAAVNTVLADPAAARRASKRADRVIRRDYTWQAVAAHTVDVYKSARDVR